MGKTSRKNHIIPRTGRQTSARVKIVQRTYRTLCQDLSTLLNYPRNELRARARATRRLDQRGCWSARGIISIALSHIAQPIIAQPRPSLILHSTHFDIAQALLHVPAMKKYLAARQAAVQPASQPFGQPARQPAGQPANQSASQPERLGPRVRRTPKRRHPPSPSGISSSNSSISSTTITIIDNNTRSPTRSLTRLPTRLPIRSPTRSPAADG